MVIARTIHHDGTEAASSILERNSLRASIDPSLAKLPWRIARLIVFVWGITLALPITSNAQDTSVEHPSIAERPSVVAAEGRGRYVQIILEGEDFLNLAEVEVISKDQKGSDGKGVNLAIGKRTLQSSTALAPAHSGKAVDGNTDGAFENGSVSHTNKEKGAWWQVDLGKTELIKEVRIWNREDGLADRLQKFRVTLSDSSITQTEFTPEELDAFLSQGHHTWGYLRIPGYAVLLLSIAFGLHIFWWRIHPPRNQNGALFIVFIGTLIAGQLICASFPFRIQPIKDVWELLLFLSIYAPLVLAYISLYSLVEEESPSIAMVNYLARAPQRTRSLLDLNSKMKLTNELLLGRRLELMKKNGLIEQSDTNILLTKKGLLWAQVFGIGARVIGLGKGA